MKGSYTFDFYTPILDKNYNLVIKILYFDADKLSFKTIVKTDITNELKKHSTDEDIVFRYILDSHQDSMQQLTDYFTDQFESQKQGIYVDYCKNLIIQVEVSPKSRTKKIFQSPKILTRVTFTY